MAYLPDLIPSEERERYARGNMGKYADVAPLAEVLEHLRRL